MADETADILPTKQQQAIVALVNHPTIRKAAEACEVGERTIYTWLGQEVFAREFRKARRQAFSQAIGLAQKYSPMAVQALAQVTTDPTAQDAARVSAAAHILKFSRESIELDDVVERVERLERDAVARDEKGGGR